MLETTKEQGQLITGKVIGTKMDKTIKVQVERTVKHPLYDKYIKRHSKMFAHDQNNTCKMGDVVLIKQSRPISKMKHWVLVKVLEKDNK